MFLNHLWIRPALLKWGTVVHTTTWSLRSQSRCLRLPHYCRVITYAALIMIVVKYTFMENETGEKNNKKEKESVGVLFSINNASVYRHVENSLSLSSYQLNNMLNYNFFHSRWVCFCLILSPVKEVIITQMRDIVLLIAINYLRHDEITRFVPRFLIVLVLTSKNCNSPTSTEVAVVLR